MNNRKKLIKYFLASAMLMAGLVGFTGCSTDDEPQGIIVSQNPDDDLVVDFVFNVSTSNGAQTRQSSDNVQATPAAFRGITDAYLMSFKVGTTTGTAPNQVFTPSDGQIIHDLTDTPTADKVYDLATVLTAGQIQGNEATGTKSRRVLELAMPVGTNTLMFWGRAIKDGGDNEQGSISATMSSTLSNIRFALKSRLESGSDEATNYENTEKLLAAALNWVIQSELVNYPVTFGGTENVTIAWSDYSRWDTSVTPNRIAPRIKDPVEPTEDLCSIGEALAVAYITLNTIYTGEFRAGSGHAVAIQLSDLYSTINPIATRTAQSLHEAISITVASTIVSRINSLINNPGTDNPTWKSAQDIINALNDGVNYGSAASQNLNNFPSAFGLADGTAQLDFDKGDVVEEGGIYKFVTKHEATSSSKAPGFLYRDRFNDSSSLGLFTYYYPAELCYFGNSSIRVSDNEHTPAQYPDGTGISESTYWNNSAAWSGNAPSSESATGATDGTDWKKYRVTASDYSYHVLSSTRSVAMKDNINYGTAMLKTTVRYGANTLYDNNHAIQEARTGANEDNATITASATAFELTGLLIGGAVTEVGWNYISVTDPDDDFQAMVFDNDINDTQKVIPAYTAAGAKSSPVYTMLWDNWNSDQLNNKQNDVYIALEFVNKTGKSFWGQHNLIKNNEKFYLMGLLNPDASWSTTDRGEGIIWPGAKTNNSDTRHVGYGYALPPYDASGNTIEQRRIFIQDHVTDANFVIYNTSLQHAYLTVPDLRSTDITLGLSVDLNWRQGIHYTGVELGAD